MKGCRCLALGVWLGGMALSATATEPAATASFAQAVLPAAPCAAPDPLGLWPVLPASDPAWHVAELAREPQWPLAGGMAFALVAGAALMGFGVWRWVRQSHTPPWSEAELAAAGDPAVVEGWRLSRFDDLPDPSPPTPVRPLYESLDDEVEDIEPLPPRAERPSDPPLSAVL